MLTGIKPEGTKLARHEKTRTVVSTIGIAAADNQRLHERSMCTRSAWVAQEMQGS